MDSEWSCGGQLSLCSQVAWVLVIGLSLLCIWASSSCSELIPVGSPLGRILPDWSMYSHYPISKEILAYYCNTVWPTYILNCGGKAV